MSEELDKRAESRKLRALLISSSYMFGSREFLGYCRDDVVRFLPSGSRVLFVPFAYGRYDEYTTLVRSAFDQHQYEVVGAHEIPDISVDSLTSDFDAVFCGGGNTFRLLAALYRRDLLEPIRAAVQQGLRYMGSSAGANVAGPTVGTTNDMPIIEVPSLKALGLVPFNINPHYYELPTHFPHMGETRRDRIHEFQELNCRAVVALREGSLLEICDDRVRLLGRAGGILFDWDGVARCTVERSLEGGADLAHLLA